jgi:hypothetical protein
MPFRVLGLTPRYLDDLFNDVISDATCGRMNVVDRLQHNFRYRHLCRSSSQFNTIRFDQ